MTLERLKKIPILECGIILPEESKDSVYKICKLNAWATIGDFLYSFSPKEKDSCVLMQEKGIFDLLRFLYFEKIAKELIHILESFFFLYVNQDPVVSIDLLARLGFSPTERECLTTFLLSQNKTIITTEPLIYYLVRLFHETKIGQIVLPLSKEEATVFERKVVLCIQLYRKYIFGKKRKEVSEGLTQLKMEKH